MKVQANEIRVGNIFNRIHGKGYTETVINEMLMAEIFGQSLEYALSDFEPIPLTEDWLIRFGFEKYGDDIEEGMLRKERLIINKDFRLRYSDSNDDFYYTFSVEIKHVHQLQNLYFALTQTELTPTP